MVEVVVVNNYRELLRALDMDAGGTLLHVDNYRTDAAHAALAIRALIGERDKLLEAAKSVIESRLSTYKAGNGRQVGIQDENGEKCWIVPFDEMWDLERAALGETK